MAIESTQSGDVAVLSCSGPLTAPTGKTSFLEALEAQLREGRVKLVLDMREVPYMDSPTIGAMMGCFKQAIERGGGVKLALGPTGKVREILQLQCLQM